MELSDADLAARVVDTLNRFVGSLHAVRCTAAFWIAHAEKPGFRFAAKYSLQMTFGTAMITLRKFHDLHLGGHLERLVGEDTEAAPECAWILGECERRHTQDAANLLFAHYAPQRADPPLSSEEVLAIIHDGGWATEEEFLEWIGPMIHRLCSIRDRITTKYSLPIGSRPPEDL